MANVKVFADKLSNQQTDEGKTICPQSIEWGEGA